MFLDVRLRRLRMEDEAAYISCHAQDQDRTASTMPPTHLGADVG